MHFSINVLAIILWLFSCVTFADDSAIDKYRNYTPEQISKLPEQDINSSVPMMYLFAARTGLSEGSSLFFAKQLNILMYPGVNDYENAIKSFQKDLGDKVTGVLTVSQINTLEERSSIQKLSRISFPSDYFSTKTNTYAKVSGTIMIHDARIMWPVNLVKLECYKSDKYCELNQLSIRFPGEDSWYQQFSVMQDTPQFYEITNWSDNTIDAKPTDPGNSCRVTNFNLNFKTKEFYQITRNGTGDCKTILGTTFPKLEKPRISQIVDGKDIIDKEFSALHDKAFSLLSSSFKDKVKKLNKDKVKKPNKDNK